MRRLSPSAILRSLATLCCAATPAAAQLGSSGVSTANIGGPLPSIGTNPNVGDLRPQLESYFARPTGLERSLAPAWLITPSMGVDVGVTDNARRVNSPRQADVFTILSPAIIVNHEAPRLRVNLIYNPSISVYASQTNQTQFSNQFAGQALGTIVPDLFYLDLRGNITQSSLIGNGLTNQSTTSTYNRQNQVQTITVSATPYLEHRFGGWGTGRIGYSFARSLQDAADGQVIVNNNPNSLNTFNTFGQPGYGTTGNLTTQRERASFSSGENLGRFNDLAVIQATQYSGSGSYRGAHRNEVSNEVGFAVTRQITALAGFGYQDIAFSGVPPVRIQEPTWNVGGRYNPNPDTTLTLLFGRRDGAASISFDGQFAPTAQTRLFARYSTGITSDIEDAQNLLDTTSVGPTGLVTDSVTGAPVSGGSTFGTQNGVYRVKRFSVTGLLLRYRDSYSATVGTEDRTTLTSTTNVFGNGVVPAGTSSTSVYGSVSWQHDLAPDMSTVVTGQYGITNNTSQFVTGGNGQQRTISLSAALTKQFTETLSGSIRYTFNDQSGTGQSNGFGINSFQGRNLNTGSYTENVLLVGLRKSF